MWHPVPNFCDLTNAFFLILPIYVFKYSVSMVLNVVLFSTIMSVIWFCVLYTGKIATCIHAFGYWEPFSKNELGHVRIKPARKPAHHQCVYVQLPVGKCLTAYDWRCAVTAFWRVRSKHARVRKYDATIFLNLSIELTAVLNNIQGGGCVFFYSWLSSW